MLLINRIYYISFALLLCYGSNSAFSQQKWTPSANEDGIQVFTRPGVNSKMKAVKVSSIFNATPTQVVAAILDVKTCNEWVYHSKINTLIRQLSPVDLIYYSRVEVPWPVEDRDYVVAIHTEQNPQTKVITITSPCVPGYVPEKKGIVRISHSVGQWTITPMGKNQTRAEYMLEVDPGGNIPAWLINLFATKGPTETFRNLKTHVQKDVYKKARLDAIAD
jgi:hypothetical protein